MAVDLDGKLYDMAAPEYPRVLTPIMVVRMVRDGDEVVIEAEVPDSQESDLAAWASSPNLLEGYP